MFHLIQRIPRSVQIRSISTFTPVSIDYSDLLGTSDLSSKLDSALGRTGLGIIAVRNIPSYPSLRRKFLKQGHSLALLDASDKAPLIVKGVSYPMGWRHGTDQYHGVPDFSKGSFYANPEVESSPVAHEWPANVWPVNSLPGFKENFRGLGQEVIRIGGLLARHLDSFLAPQFSKYSQGMLEDIFVKEKCQVGRLLYYYPQQDTVQDWCGWHNDHSVVTGLTAPMYIDHGTGEIICDGEIEREEVGLFVRNRNKERVKATAEADVLYFQTGEAAQILSGGRLQATPHAVLTDGRIGNVARSTFAVFMQPRENYVMKTDNENAAFIEHEGVPSLRGRWKQGMTHGEFFSATMKTFYTFS